MLFVNRGSTRLIRIGPTEECSWVNLDKGQTIDLPASEGRKLDLEEVTEGKIGETKVETKQFEPVKKKDNFRKEIRNINGIGKKIAEDIIKVFPTEEELIKSIKSYEHLPFRDDVAEKLIKKYGK